jgi:hypothetical protein
LGHHDSQPARYDTNHVVPFRLSVQDSVIDLLDDANTVIRVYDLVTNFVIHDFGCPFQVPREV